MKNAFLCAAAVSLACGLAGGQQVKVLHSFSGPDGFTPTTNLIVDPAGNLYGTTPEGGANSNPYCQHNCGVVFELSPTANGVQETVLYNFCSVTDCIDGAVPAAPLVRDAAGNLYGTTNSGGGYNSNCPYGSLGCGVVFELTPNSDGTWTEIVLYAFNGEDAGNPAGGLVFDSAGDLYGTTQYAPNSGGVVFELSPRGGSWSETVLYTFTPYDGPGGSHPISSLVLDKAGNLYGTTLYGGGQNCDCGVVFELTPIQGGSWQETVLYTFTDGADGGFPYAGITIDSSGDLFGTTMQGGNSNCPPGCGVAFELTRGSGGWTEHVLFSFSGGAGGGYPYGGLIISPQRRLYGTTFSGGSNEKYGVVFELSPTRNGSWEEKMLSLGGRFGIQPIANLTLGSSGQVYGTTSAGGVGKGGVVFEIAP